MAKVLGIGGVFLHFEGEEKELLKWYQKYLGFDICEYGTNFIEGPQLVLLSFKRSNSKGPYLNLRVDDIGFLFNQFKLEGIEIVDDIKEYSYGKFGQFKDPFGNVVELWEPDSEAYIKMVQKEIEDYKKK